MLAFRLLRSACRSASASPGTGTAAYRSCMASAASAPTSAGAIARWALPATAAASGWMAYPQHQQVVPWQDLTFSSRSLATQSGADKAKKAHDDLMEQQEKFDTLTDKIPEKPVGVVEGTSYSVVILAGLALAGATVWAVVKELLLEPKEYTVFNQTLEYIKNDPRVTVRLGTSISGYGADSRNRSARQRIPNRIYTDNSGVEHVQVQFQAKGSSGGATVHADMYRDSSKQWQYSYLYVDVDAPHPQRLVLVNPQYAAH